MTEEQRESQIQGLRRLADFLEATDLEVYIGSVYLYAGLPQKEVYDRTAQVVDFNIKPPEPKERTGRYVTAPEFRRLHECPYNEGIGFNPHAEADHDASYACWDGFELDEAKYQEACLNAFAVTARKLAYGAPLLLEIPAWDNKVEKVPAWEKQSTNDSIQVIRRFGYGVDIRASMNHEDAACERIVVGTKTVKRRSPEAIRVAVESIPEEEVEEEVVEYKCPPTFFGLTREGEQS